MEHATAIREAFDELLDDMEYQGVRPRTIDVCRRNVEPVLRDTGVEQPEDVTDGHLAAQRPRAGTRECMGVDAVRALNGQGLLGGPAMQADSP